MANGVIENTDFRNSKRIVLLVPINLIWILNNKTAVEMEILFSRDGLLSPYHVSFRCSITSRTKILDHSIWLRYSFDKFREYEILKHYVKMADYVHFARSFPLRPIELEISIFVRDFYGPWSSYKPFYCGLCPRPYGQSPIIVHTNLNRFSTDFYRIFHTKRWS
jgi:hypothetical protein